MASEFDHHAAASDKCQREKRKTIMGDDLLWAMSTLGFENYTEPLKTYLFRYREMVIACSLARHSCQQLGCVALTVNNSVRADSEER